MQSDDPHEVLGVSKNATEDEIKEAYRDKVKKYHPDVSDFPDAERKFRRIREAYDSLLSDVDGGRTSGNNTGSGGTRRHKKDRSGGARSGQRKTAGEDGRDGDGRGGNRSGTAGSDTDPDFKVMETYADGWTLAVCREGTHVGEWFLYRDRGGGGRSYLTLGGDKSDERVYFGTRKQAERGYANYSETDPSGRSTSTGDDRRTAKRRRSGYGRSGTADPRGSRSGGTEIHGEEVGGFDSLWSLYKRDDDGNPLWAVVSEAFGSPYYLNGSGNQQRDGFWFGSRSDAEDAYEAYMRGADDVGGPSRNLTGGTGPRNDRGRRHEERTRKVERESDGSRRPPVSVLGTVLDAIALRERLGNVSSTVRVLLMLLGAAVVYAVARLVSVLIA